MNQKIQQERKLKKDLIKSDGGNENICKQQVLRTRLSKPVPIDTNYVRKKLHDACLFGDLDAVKNILSAGLEDINFKAGLHSETAVMVAVDNGYEAIFDFLVSKGSDLKLRNSMNNTVFHLAVWNGYTSIVRKLLDDHQFDIEDKGSDGRSALMLAIRYNQRVMIDFLLSRGCRLKVVDSNCESILHMACLGGSVKMLQYILSNDIVDIDIRGKYGWTPLMKAAEEGYKTVVDILINEGCNWNAVDDNNNNALHYACTVEPDDEEQEEESEEEDDDEDQEEEDYEDEDYHEEEDDDEEEEEEEDAEEEDAEDEEEDEISHVYVLKYLLSKGIDIESRGENGWTPFLWAACFGNARVIELLISQGSDITAVDDFGNNYFHVACTCYELPSVKYFLSKGTDIESRGGKDQRTPVLTAARHHCKYIVDFLINKGCSLKSVDKYNDTVLHMACYGGDASLTATFLSKGIDIESRGKHGRTPVMAAAFTGSISVVELLISKGCDLKAVDNFNNNALHSVCFSYAESEAGLVEWHEDLEWDELDFVSVTKLLLSKGMDIESRGQNEWTPVMGAAYYGNIELIELLVSKGCNLSVVDEKKDNILHVACRGGDVDVVKYFLAKGSDIESRAKDGRTPVMTAARYGERDVVYLLVNYNCNLKSVDKNNDNVLHWAQYGDDVDVVEYLLSKGADIESRGQQGWTPVMTAAFKGSRRVFEFLLNKRCNLKAVDDQGNTISHYACIGGKVDMVEYLIDEGLFDEKVKNDDGLTPGQMASEGHDAIVALLNAKIR